MVWSQGEGVQCWRIQTSCDHCLQVTRHRLLRIQEYVYCRNHEFFNYDNREALELRVQVANAALEDTLKFLKEDGDISIFDATNATRERRKQIFDLVRQNGFKCLFLESVCDNPKLIEV